jgi:dCMP deaminase
MTPERATKFIGIARAVALLSKDRRTKVGALAIGPSGEIRVMGYNGFPRGCDDSLEHRHERPEKYQWTEHAERNLIYNAARIGVSLEGCILVVTPLFPCMDCARGIVQAGFNFIIAEAEDNPRWKESNDKAMELFNEVNIGVLKI